MLSSEVLPFCEANGISFVPWGPLAYGLLGGRYGRDFKLDDKDWRQRSGAFDAQTFEDNIECVERLKAIAEGKGAPLAHVAVQWLLSRPAVASVIAGAKRVEQVEDNARADALALDAATLKALNMCLE